MGNTGGNITESNKTAVMQIMRNIVAPMAETPEMRKIAVKAKRKITDDMSKEEKKNAKAENKFKKLWALQVKRLNKKLMEALNHLQQYSEGKVVLKKSKILFDAYTFEELQDNLEAAIAGIERFRDDQEYRHPTMPRAGYGVMTTIAEMVGKMKALDVQIVPLPFSQRHSASDLHECFLSTFGNIYGKIFPITCGKNIKWRSTEKIRW